ncbi:hypothetical protein SteCoe_25213 [Stentor coeruleus]|uniref:Uncharacterized protein n=1 Tax=Stentor coeruleus TaxID=5963 RepID=A0A1R2BFR9_9CILI|nr:hypothetical protein SteCoe_25213 [Stentor coeruleus]
MCTFNLQCPVTDGSCKCLKQIASPGVIKPIPIPAAFPNDPNMLSALYRLIVQQNEMMRNISGQIQDALVKVLQFAESNQKIENNLAPQTEEVTTPSSLLKFLCCDLCNHSHSLQIANEMPSPAYKERAFSVVLNIVDSNGVKVRLRQNLVFKVMLFTADSPPKLLAINTSGDKIMRGTLEAEGNSVVVFKKIIIKEVTSHFRNGSFFFVVVAKDTNFIRPFIYPEFVIKARKIYPDCPKKKFKTENCILSSQADDENLDS